MQKTILITGASSGIGNAAARLFAANHWDVFATIRSSRMIGSDDVAQVIYRAATDGSAQLRYLVGHDNPPFIKARREMADQPFIDFMRSHFK